MTTLAEEASKRLLADHGMPVAAERSCLTPDDAAQAAAELGFPVVAKLNGANIAHKTERGLVRLNLPNADAVLAAAAELFAAATSEDGQVSVLVAPMIRGNRELIAGLVRDPQFGMCVMLGVGGILAEAVRDVAFRLVPLTRVDAEELLDDLATQTLLGPFRGEPAVDRERLVDVVLSLAALAEADPRVQSVDVNPLIVRSTDGVPIAVDALVEVAT